MDRFVFFATLPISILFLFSAASGGQPDWVDQTPTHQTKEATATGTTKDPMDSVAQGAESDRLQETLFVTTHEKKDSGPEAISLQQEDETERKRAAEKSSKKLISKVVKRIPPPPPKTADDSGYKRSSPKVESSKSSQSHQTKEATATGTTKDPMDSVAQGAESDRLQETLFVTTHEKNEGPNLGDDRITQVQIAEGILSFKEILDFGLRIFSTPFNKFDGYGDQRSTLQGNGTFLRVNGLDAQSCLECHSIVSSATIPTTFGVGGAGASSSNVIFRPSYINMEYGNMDGRFINPPFLFGSGGVELLAKEMTILLQELKAQALANPGVEVTLEAKGVSFGTIMADRYGNLDTSNIEGINQDLVVRPFGRKGEFSTVRAFDRGAMQFHFGMQPVEVVGEGEDPDEDGVKDEILIGELSALHIWSTSLPKPEMVKLSENSSLGFMIFNQIGCANCHRPFLNTNNKLLTYSYEEVEEDPTANIFYEIDLTKTANFRPNKDGGIDVPLFADLKRHDMGPGLAESFEGDVPKGEFTTARLWGVADTAPYLHDGRALTITGAIFMHGGEAEDSRNDFAALDEKDMHALLSFLHSLRTPKMASKVK